MTGKKLLKKKNTRYLFTQNGFNFYKCGHRFYKVETHCNYKQAIPVDIKNSEKEVITHV